MRQHKDGTSQWQKNFTRDQVCVSFRAASGVVKNKDKCCLWDFFGTMEGECLTWHNWFKGIKDMTVYVCGKCAFSELDSPQSASLPLQSRPGTEPHYRSSFQKASAFAIILNAGKQKCLLVFKYVLSLVCPFFSMHPERPILISFFLCAFSSNFLPVSTCFVHCWSSWFPI